jgi:hypothetical protein
MLLPVEIGNADGRRVPSSFRHSRLRGNDELELACWRHARDAARRHLIEAVRV